MAKSTRLLMLIQNINTLWGQRCLCLPVHKYPTGRASVEKKKLKAKPPSLIDAPLLRARLAQQSGSLPASNHGRLALWGALGQRCPPLCRRRGAAQFAASAGTGKSRRNSSADETAIFRIPVVLEYFLKSAGVQRFFAVVLHRAAFLYFFRVWWPSVNQTFVNIFFCVEFYT